MNCSEQIKKPKLGLLQQEFMTFTFIQEDKSRTP